jgi:hypothetical protein
VVKPHGKDGPTVTWLDVVEFAKNKPEQFNLEKSRNGVRICQFYTKQCRVEISEEDFVLIASGMPQKMIPPQPIIEDEEKELGALEILEKNLQQITQMADQGRPGIFFRRNVFLTFCHSRCPSSPAQLPPEEPPHRDREPSTERRDFAIAYWRTMARTQWPFIPCFAIGVCCCQHSSRRGRGRRGQSAVSAIPLLTLQH